VLTWQTPKSATLQHKITVQKTLIKLITIATLFMLAGSGDEPGTITSETIRNSPLIVIGIDGATWDVIDPMIAAGELPNFARLKNQGAYGSLITVGPQVPPVVWTSSSTGQFARQHGIIDFASHSVWKYYDDSDYAVKADQETKKLPG